MFHKNFSILGHFSLSENTQKLFLEFLSNDGKLDVSEIRRFFASIHGKDYFTDEFYKDHFVAKGDLDGDGFLSISEMSTAEFEIETSALCLNPRLRTTEGGLFAKMKKLLY